MICDQTFVASKGTAFYRLRTADEDVALVLTLLAHGCPVQASVAALGYDERTIASWQRRAGVRACACSLNILVCVDGLPSYVTAFLRVFRNPLRTGQPGRPRLLLAEGLLIGQVIKQYVQRRVVSVEHRIKRGTAAAIGAVLMATHTGTQINTAYVERLNATFRSCLATLVRRGRAIAHKDRVLTKGPATFSEGVPWSCVLD